MGRASRDKGKRGELEAVRLLRAAGYEDARRGVLQSRGAEVADVEGTPWWLEIKRGSRPNIRRALEQGLGDTDGRPVVVLSRDDRGPWLVTVRWQDLARVLGAVS